MSYLKAVLRDSRLEMGVTDEAELNAPLPQFSADAFTRVQKKREYDEVLVNVAMGAYNREEFSEVAAELPEEKREELISYMENSFHPKEKNTMDNAISISVILIFFLLMVGLYLRKKS